jgi:hypothetical protein
MQPCNLWLEFLDPVIAVVRDIYVSAAVHCYSGGSIKLPDAASQTAPLRYVCSGTVEFLYPVITGVRDINVAAGVQRNSGRIIKLRIAASYAAPLC